MATREEILEVIDKFLSFAEGAAALTPVKFDDAAVNVLRVIRNSDLLMDWLLDRVLGTAGIPDGVFSVESLPENVAAEFRNRGIERPALGKFLELIMPILVSLLNKWITGSLPSS